MTIKCATCGTPTDELALFPGKVCVECYAKTPEGRRMPTANELAGMWSGRRQTRRARS